VAIGVRKVYPLAATPADTVRVWGEPGLPLAVLFMFVQRHLIAGFGAGAVKG
jgi:hypothetical protein